MQTPIYWEDGREKWCMMDCTIFYSAKYMNRGWQTKQKQKYSCEDAVNVYMYVCIECTGNSMCDDINIPSQDH